VTIANNGTIEIANSGTLILEANEFILESGGKVNGKGKGFSAGNGPGKGESARNATPNSGGGGHGGKGGRGMEGINGGVYYDSAYGPQLRGSGAGVGIGDQPGAQPKGAGGGVFILRVITGGARIDGIIDVSGEDGNATRYGIGGGAGGTVLINTRELQGTGGIRSNGGKGSTQGGGGGAGGRIAVWYESGEHMGLSDGEVSGGVKGGNQASRDGESGTLSFFRKVNNNVWNQFVYASWHWQQSDSNFFPMIGDITLLNTSARLEEAFSSIFPQSNILFDHSSLLVRGDAGMRSLQLSGDLTFKNNSSITCFPSGKQFLVLSLGGNFFLENGSTIDFSFCGHPPGEGPGAAENNPSRTISTGGAGFGGRGGAAISYGGLSYGSAHVPNGEGVMLSSYLGSGGGNSRLGTAGAGGGAVFFGVGVNAILDGEIKSNGQGGGAAALGGGSGGSIVLRVGGALSGRGNFVALGGAGGTSDNVYFGGGGAGGRIAVYYHGGSIDGFADSSVAPGSSGGLSLSGEYGTLGFFDDSFVPARFTSYSGWEWLSADRDLMKTPDPDDIEGDFDYDSILLKDVVLARIETDLSLFGKVSDFSMENSQLVLRGDNPGIRKISVLSGISLRNSQILGDGKYIDFELSGEEFTMDSSSHISLDGAGDPQGRGDGAGLSASGNGSGGGAGHGGLGGDFDAVHGRKYGSALIPHTTGSGGGNGVGYGADGGAGGGRLFMNFSTRSNVFGTITVNGNDGGNSVYAGGGGAGGSVYLKTGTFIFTPTARVEANGGNGGYSIIGSGGAGGAGGRLIIEVNTFEDDFVLNRRLAAHPGLGRRGAQDGGEGTSAFISTVSTPNNRTIIVYNSWELVDEDAQEGLSYVNVDRLIGKEGSKIFIEGKGNAKILYLSNDQRSLPALLLESTEMTVEKTFSIDADESAGDITLVNSTIQGKGSNVAFTLRTTGNILIDDSSRINFDGTGYGPSLGTGSGQDSNNSMAGGGGYGGKGAFGVENGGSGGGYYGSAVRPDIDTKEVFGSGGGNFRSSLGSSGGGAVKMVAEGIDLFGMITANGGISESLGTGGGSGGTIFLDAKDININGSISANGSPGEMPGRAGGGGGRIAVYYQTLSGDPSLAIAFGGNNGLEPVKGEHGSVGFFHRNVNDVPPDLEVYKHWAFTGEDTSLWNFVDFTVFPGALVRVDDIVPKKQDIKVNGSMSARPGSRFSLWSDFSFVVGGSLSFEGEMVGKKENLGIYIESQNENGLISIAGDGIDLTGSGFAAGMGPGYGHSKGDADGVGGGGGSYGGLGGGETEGTYGNPEEPPRFGLGFFGSGGGNFNGRGGGVGGGVVEITTKGELVIVSNITVDGARALTSAGGGSGGTISFSAKKISGNGELSLRGGEGGLGLPFGNGGGGGRLYICHGNESEPNFVISLAGGIGSENGAAGTSYVSGLCFSQELRRFGYLETSFGDIYAKGSISATASPPDGRYNATFVIAADGTIGQSVISKNIDLVFPQGNEQNTYGSIFFPSQSTKYRSNTGSIDILGIMRGRYGSVIKLQPNNQDITDRILNDGDNSRLGGNIYFYENESEADENISLGNMRGINFLNTSLTGQSGAGLIVIKGANLRVIGDFFYEVNEVSRLSNLASLGILVLSDERGFGGNISIDAMTEHSVGAFYAEKALYTGSSEKLLIHEGLMVAREFFFERQRLLREDAEDEPSEQIIYDGRVIANTPPGLSDFSRALPVFSRAGY
jgi:hypothetical protein